MSTILFYKWLDYIAVRQHPLPSKCRFLSYDNFLVSEKKYFVIPIKASAVMYRNEYLRKGKQTCKQNTIPIQYPVYISLYHNLFFLWKMTVFIEWALFVILAALSIIFLGISTMNIHSTCMLYLSFVNCFLVKSLTSLACSYLLS